MSDMLRAVAVGLGAKNVTRYYDILHPAPVDNRSANEIIADITARAGLKVVGENNERNGTDGHAGD